jgi:hypothetical protein
MNAKELFPDIKKIKPTIEAILYLIEQIENCEQQLQTMQQLNDDGFVFPFPKNDFKLIESEKEKYFESLIKCLNEL